MLFKLKGRERDSARPSLGDFCNLPRRSFPKVDAERRVVVVLLSIVGIFCLCGWGRTRTNAEVHPPAPVHRQHQQCGSTQIPSESSYMICAPSVSSRIRVLRGRGRHGRAPASPVALRESATAFVLAALMRSDQNERCRLQRTCFPRGGPPVLIKDPRVPVDPRLSTAYSRNIHGYL